MIWHRHTNGRSHAFESTKHSISVCGCLRIDREPVDSVPVYPCATCVARTKGREGDKEKKMDIKGMIYTLLQDRGCKLKEEVGIVTITTPDGAVWDMTIPQRNEKKEKRGEDQDRS